MVSQVVRFIALVCIVCFSSCNAAAELTTKQAKSLINMPNTPMKQGSFTQTKTLKVLKKPFQSSGVYEVNGDSFNWTTLKPVVNTLSFDGETLWQLSQGEKKQEIPAAAHYINVIRALVMGDLTQLSKHFVFRSVNSNNCIKLAPKNEQFVAIAESVGFCSNKGTLTVTLFEARGNVTKIMINRQNQNQNQNQDSKE